MEPHSTRIAAISVSLQMLEQALKLDELDLQITGIQPPNPLIYHAREAVILVEGPSCPVVFEGEQIPWAGSLREMRATRLAQQIQRILREKQKYLLWVDEHKDGERLTPKVVD